MPSRILVLPFAIAALVFLYLTWEVDESYATYIIGPFVVSALILTFAPQINWWWYSKYPPKLDQNIRLLLRQHFLYYHNLAVDQKEKFRNRLSLFMIGNDFTPQGFETVPEDIKGMIAAEAVKLTFGYPKFLFSDFEKIIIYLNPFPSPQYPQNFHASEVFEEDGVLLISTPQIAKAFFEPRGYLSLPLYEYARIFMLTYPNEPYPVLGDKIWDNLQEISGYNLDAIQQWINLPPDQIDVRGVAIHHFFNYSKSFKSIAPDIFQSYVLVFRQDPTILSYPVIK